MSCACDISAQVNGSIVSVRQVLCDRLEKPLELNVKVKYVVLVLKATELEKGGLVELLARLVNESGNAN